MRSSLIGLPLFLCFVFCVVAEEFRVQSSEFRVQLHHSSKKEYVLYIVHATVCCDMRDAMLKRYMLEKIFIMTSKSSLGIVYSSLQKN